MERASTLSTDPGGKGLSVSGPVTDEAIQLLAIGHARGGRKNLVVPFIRDGLEVDIG
jgi:fructose-1-phosphate kinase PfkB-like protein